MKKTTVVNLYKEKPDAYIGRKTSASKPYFMYGALDGMDGIFGNPFPVGRGYDLETSLRHFERYFLNRMFVDDDFRHRVEALRGKKLGCFCSPKPCHGDIIARYLNDPEEQWKNSNIAM